MNVATPVPPTPLSIAVVGVGGIGSTFAFNLARAGHDVTVIARPGSLRLQQLERDQAIVSLAGERAPTHVADHLDEAVFYDLIVVTTLAHQVAPLLGPLSRSRARCVHFMFNTFDPEALRRTVGEARCTFGMPAVMATVDPEGKLRSTIVASRKTLHGDQRWVDLFNGAGLPSAFEANMPLWLRCHVPFCIAFEAISVAGVRRGGGASWAEAMAAARAVHGGFSIIRGLGFQLYPRSKSVTAATPAFMVAGMLWSISRIKSFRELLATGLNECRALIDVLAEAGMQVRPPLLAAKAAVIRAKPDIDISPQRP